MSIVDEAPDFVYVLTITTMDAKGSKIALVKTAGHEKLKVTA
jgi:hypothetical protein